MPPRDAFRAPWDKAYYDYDKENIDKMRVEIATALQRSEDNLKTAVSNFNELRSKVSQQERTDKGSLAVRPLSEFIHMANDETSDIIEAAHLTTILLCVPRVRSHGLPRRSSQPVTGTRNVKWYPCPSKRGP